MRFRGDVQAINARRTWVIEQLAALIRNGAIPKDDTWIRAILDWFTVHGLFIVRKPSLTSEFLAVRFHSVSNTFEVLTRVSLQVFFLYCHLRLWGECR